MRSAAVSGPQEAEHNEQHEDRRDQELDASSVPCEDGQQEHPRGSEHGPCGAAFA